MSATKNTGTKEWAIGNVNIVTGCSHNCRYCYAHGMARRFGRVEDWSKPVLRAVKINASKAKGTIMFPSSHDIEPAFLEPCVDALGKLLGSGTHRIMDWTGRTIRGLNGETTFVDFETACKAIAAIVDRDLADDGIDESHPNYEKLYDEYRSEYYAVPDEGGDA